MSRLSREKKREHKQAVRAATPAAPIEVHVPRAGTDSPAGPGGASDGASVGGVPVFAAPGEEIQRAVLARLHHIALATGHPVLATVDDERIGYVVPLRVDPDGSSHFTSEPVPKAPGPQPPPPGAPERQGPVLGAAVQRQHPDPGVPGVPGAPEPRQSDPAVREPQRPAPAASEPPRPGREDSATHVLRPAPERGAAPTFPLRAVPEPQPAGEPVPTFELRAVRDDAPPVPPAPPGTVAPPTGSFGPPPAMEVRPLPGPEDAPARRPAPVPEAALLAADPDPKPTPPRGFDAVAEAVLGDEPLTAPGDPTAPALLAEPVVRINEAVKEGRLDAAAELAEQTVTRASGTLGPEHPEVLRLRELGAYISYLAGDPLRAFRMSLDLAGARRRTGDAEGAYGNVRSAATAWRAVRDAATGLELGHELIALWTELAAEGGAAAEEIEELESARARMGRLAARAGGA
ncbi:tetratricopeptide repeat protein [Streptomyces sp. NPDC055952]|uniref:tetratricopeptide repeat protein n=1 Tax=Streptomyces sp. NPDC055952 TaxID=3345663 RepID=UPI0035DD6FD0